MERPSTDSILSASATVASGTASLHSTKDCILTASGRHHNSDCALRKSTYGRWAIGKGRFQGRERDMMARLVCRRGNVR